MGTYVKEVGQKKHRELGETTLGELLPKAWIYIHTAWAKFFFCFFFWGGGWDSIIALSHESEEKLGTKNNLFILQE